MLSVTHAKPNRKVFSNHGAEFTSTATIKIDLAKLEKELVSNLHLDESKDFEISLPRKIELRLNRGKWNCTSTAPRRTEKPC